MEEKYKKWHRIQVISCIMYAVSVILLWWMIYAESLYTLMIIMAVIATVLLILTSASGLIRAFIGYKMGLRSSKKDWIILGITIILVILYMIAKHL